MHELDVVVALRRRQAPYQAWLVVVVSLLVPSGAAAQNPWDVTVLPSFNPLPVGFCSPVQVRIVDPIRRDVPRNPLGARVTIADFDMTVKGGPVVGHQIDASHWEVCACQGAQVGSTLTITATYPAQALARQARVPGVAFESTATLTLAAPKGTSNPPACTTPSPVAAASVAAPIGPQPLEATPLPPGVRTPVAAAPRFWDHWNLPNTPPSSVNFLNGDYTLVIRIERMP